MKYRIKEMETKTEKDTLDEILSTLKDVADSLHHDCYTPLFELQQGGFIKYESTMDQLGILISDLRGFRSRFNRLVSKKS